MTVRTVKENDNITTFYFSFSKKEKQEFLFIRTKIEFF